MERLSPSAKVHRVVEQTWRKWPFIAGFTARWTVIEDPSVGTACTNGPELRYAPDYVDGMSLQEAFDLVTEEGAHLFLGHHTRMRGRNPRFWNIACDLAIFGGPIGKNMDLTSRYLDSACVPGRGRFANFPWGLSAEQYYPLVVEAYTPPPQPQEPQESAEQGEEGEEPSEGSGDQDGQQDGSQDGEPEDQGTGEPTAQGGAGVGGPDVQDLPEPRGQVSAPPTEGKTEEEVVAEWQLQVAQAILTSQQAGSLPGWLRELGENLYGKSRTPWRAVLRRFFTKWAATRHTFERPSRRHGWRTDLIMPAKHAREVGDGCGLTDVSGSMSRRAMDAVLGELEAILTLFVKAQVTLRMADTRLVEYERTFHRWDFPLRVPIEWLGRGGTDLSGAMKTIARERRFEWLMVLSDMYWNVAECEDPGIPVIWVTTRDPEQLSASETPKFGVLCGPVEMK